MLRSVSHIGIALLLLFRLDAVTVDAAEIPAARGLTVRSNDCSESLLPGSEETRTERAEWKESRPNIVLINADDLGYGDVGCYGATKLQTPNIDRLAMEGRRFTDAHTASAVCSPSRYGLMTGQFPLRRNFWGPLPFTSELTIATAQPTIASVLKSASYDTAIIGKWHLGFGKGKTDWNKPLKPGPLELGFDYYFGMPTVNSGPPFVYVENHGVVDYDPADPFVMRTPSVTQKFPEKSGYTQIGGATKAHERYRDEFVGTTLAEKAVAWIEERAQQDRRRPFFLYLATTNIHHPFTPHPRFKGTSQCGLYGDFVHELDWIVGQILRTLDKADLAKDTLVVFTSDNGGMLNNTGQKAWKAGHRLNGDLLGFKFGAWEGGHRVPFIVRWPGRVPAGTESDALVSHVDLISTFATLSGAPLSDDVVIDGVNQLPEFLGTATEPARDMLIISPNSPQHLTVRKGKWVYIPKRDEGGFQGKKIGDHLLGGAAAQRLTGLVNSDVVDGKVREDAPAGQLYDLQVDPFQACNVHDEHPEVIAELAQHLKNWRMKIPEGARLGWINLNATKGRRNVKGDSAKGAAPRTPAGPSKRSATFDFESGTLEPWKVVEGEFGHLIGHRSDFFNNKAEYNKQGEYYLTTLEPSADAVKGLDKQTGVVISPLFVPEAGTMTFRVGGGRGPSTYAALCTTDGKEVEFARGINDQVMQKATWDLSPYVGKKMFIRIVDRSQNGWGHITVDDFQFDGKVLDEYPDLPQPVSQTTPHDRFLQPSEVAGVSLSRHTKDQPAANSQSGQPDPARPARTLPNFVVIFADDLGYGDISCYSSKGVETPYLDTLAAEGFRSTDFFIPANVCSPSRAALLAGRYPMRCGLPVARNEGIPKYRNYGFSPDELTIPELLKPAGYRSLMVGKWHLGMEVEGSHPLDAGFDEHLGIPSNYSKNRGPDYNTLFRGRRAEQRNVPCQELTKRYTDEVVDFIRRQQQRPFFIYVSHHIVHSPLLPRNEFIGTSGQSRYGDFIKELDHSTGRIMKAIRDTGLDNNTLVVFTSDNGPTGPGSSGGLSGGKYCTMEGGHRVPGMFRWPGQIPPGQVSDVTLSSMDLLPLFCELAGVELPGDRTIDGKNILPILMGRETESPHQFLYYYNGTNLQAVREGNWKLHLPRTANDQPFWSKKPNRKKGFVTLKEPCLYNLSTDLGEQTNVADRHPDVVSRLQKQAEAIRAELGDVRMTGRDQRKINLIDPQER